MPTSQESFMFTVGKLDAGMAILLGERAHLIEFPSLLLPPGATTGSIVNITVKQNITEEKKRETDFWNLQNDILETYGTQMPEAPKLELRNVTQTSVTLEWPQLELATAKLRSLDIYRDRQRLAAIPSPLTNTSTKLSGLQLDTDYTFQLVLRTTAGVFPSNLLQVRTHTMADTSGISVCFGNVEDEVLLENAKMALRDMGARWSDNIQIDTTHFVCTTPAATPSGAQASGSITTAPGVEYQKALQLSIPVVQPHWILACHTEKKMMPIRPYYLGETPSTPSGHYPRPQSMSQANLPSPRGNNASPTQQKHAINRQSMPPQRVTSASPPTSNANQPHESVVRASASADSARFAPTPEEHEPALEDEDDEARAGRTRKGTMSKNFKFPPPGSESPPPPVPPVPDLPAAPVKNDTSPPMTEPLSEPPAPPKREDEEDAELTTVGMVAPSSVEVPPPPPVEKERIPGGANDLADEDVGETEEISLN